MNLETFVIDPAEAKDKLDEYTNQIAGQRTAEDQAIAAGYRAAARGLPVISLPRTIGAGGFFEDGLPKLAIAPAAATECFVSWDSSPSWRNPDLVYADRNGWRVNRGALVGTHSVRVTVPGDDFPAKRTRYTGETIVPIVPPRFRPNPRRLRHCHLLWEVEEWKRTAPVDPALLRHIRGDLWVVLATWDLTELERYVLGAR